MKENDTESMDAIRMMWIEACDAKEVALAAYSRPNFTEDDRIAFILARQREQAMWDAYETAAFIVIARCDRELGELRP